MNIHEYRQHIMDALNRRNYVINFSGEAMDLNNYPHIDLSKKDNSSNKIEDSEIQYLNSELPLEIQNEVSLTEDSDFYITRPFAACDQSCIYLGRCTSKNSSSIYLCECLVINRYSLMYKPTDQVIQLSCRNIKLYELHLLH